MACLDGINGAGSYILAFCRAAKRAGARIGRYVHDCIRGRLARLSAIVLKPFIHEYHTAGYFADNVDCQQVFFTKYLHSHPKIMLRFLVGEVICREGVPPVELGPARITQSRDTPFLRSDRRNGLSLRSLPLDLNNYSIMWNNIFMNV